MATALLAAAAVLLPPPAAAAVAAGLSAAAGAARRTPARRLLGQTAAATIAAAAASAAAHAVGSRTGALLCAGAVYLAVTAAFRREAFARELPAVLVGLTAAALWLTDPWLAPLAAGSLFLLRNARRLPGLERRAVLDAKTGLLNMRSFTRELDRLVAEATAQREPLSLIVADLDLLRELNNEHGHLAGDAVIAGIGGMLRSQLRRGDLAGRFGGEEFLVALPGTPSDRAVRIAERIREAVEAQVFVAKEVRAELRATLSAGVATLPRDGRTSRALLHAADLAVLEAKEQGRNRVLDVAAAVRSQRRRQANSTTLRMPAWASISSNPRFTSSSDNRWETNGATSISPAR